MITKDGGYFGKMVLSTAKDSSDNLFRIAKEK